MGEGLDLCEEWIVTFVKVVKLRDLLSYLGYLLSDRLVLFLLLSGSRLLYLWWRKEPI